MRRRVRIRARFSRALRSSAVRWCLLVAPVVWWPLRTATAQLLSKSSPPPAAAPALVAAGSPRTSLQDYLRLAAAQEWTAAADYLAVPVADRDQAPVLARRLKVVLDQRLALDRTSASPLAVGDTTDGDPSGDRIGVIAGANGREIAVRLERVQGSAPTRWIFSTATVAAVNDWYEMLGAEWIRDRVPPALMREGPWHVFYWQWIAMAVLLPVLVLLAWLVGGLLRGVLLRVASRTATEWDNLLVFHLRGPFRLWVAAVAATPLLNLIDLNARVTAFADASTRGLVLLALFWGVLRVIRLIQERVASAVWASGDSQQSRTLVPLLGNILRVTLAVIAMLVTLSQFGYPVGTLLAGLGIGGIAVALAGQKTVEHLFGSVSLAADKAFRVGDWVRAGATEGMVERIGLRSTSFRTNDRTVVRIPNGRLADERIETFGERDRMFLRAELDLAYGTSAASIDGIRNAIEASVRAHPKHWPDAVRVHVVSLTDSAIRLRVFAWFQTDDWGEFLEIRHRMLLGFVDIVAEHGSAIAFPSRTVYNVMRVGEPPTPEPPSGGSGKE